jgi:hypothetical protein
MRLVDGDVSLLFLDDALLYFNCFIYLLLFISLYMKSILSLLNYLIDVLFELVNVYWLEGLRFHLVDNHGGFLLLGDSSLDLMFFLSSPSNLLLQLRNFSI